MPAVLKIGYNYFLLPEAQAVAVLKGMTKAVEVDEDFDKGQTVYYPAKKDKYKGISLTIINQDQLRPCKPGTVPVAEDQPWLISRQLQLTNGKKGKPMGAKE